MESQRVHLPNYHENEISLASNNTNFIFDECQITLEQSADLLEKVFGQGLIWTLQEKLHEYPYRTV